MEGERGALERFREAMSIGGTEADDALWDALIAMQGETFFTAKGLAFTYLIRPQPAA